MNRKFKNNKKPRPSIFVFLPFLLIYFYSCLYFGNYIMWVFLFFLLSVFILDTLYFIFFSHKTEISQQLSANLIECYGTVFLKLKLINTSLMPCFVSYKLGKKYYYHYAKKESDIPIIQTKIGMQNICISQLYIKSLFGLYVYKKLIDVKKQTQLNCFVVPIVKKLKTDIKLINNVIINPADISIYKNEYEDFIGNRDYVAGDPIKLINFKKSATLKKTVVREYNQTKIGMIYNIFIDYFDEKQFETVVECALAVNDYYLSANAERILLYGFDGYENIYDADSVVKLPTDLANYKPNRENKILWSNIRTNKLPTIYILTYFDENIHIKTLIKLASNSTIILVAEAIKHKIIIENTIKGSGSRGIVIIDEKNLIDVNSNETV